MMSELPKLEQAIESKQFVAHANSILDTELATDKVTRERFLGERLLNNVYRWQRWTSKLPSLFRWWKG